VTQIAMLEHPPNSPDIDPRYSSMFPKLRISLGWLGWFRFESLANNHSYVTTVLKGYTENDFQ